MMATVRQRLHWAFLNSLGPQVENHSPVDEKPLDVDLKLPSPPRLRVYMYSLVGGVGTTRPNEYKAILRLPGQSKGAYASFDHTGGRIAFLIAYREDLDVFVLWDASLHPRFKNGGNIQVNEATVLEAAATGRARQLRRLSTGAIEVVLLCQSSNISEAIEERMETLGGVSET